MAIDKEVHEFVTDQVRLATDSSIHSLTSMMGYLQVSQKETHDMVTTLNNNVTNALGELHTHMKRVEPMIVIFEKNKIVKMVVTDKGKLVIKCAVGIAAVAGAWNILKSVILGVLNSGVK